MSLKKLYSLVGKLYVLLIERIFLFNNWVNLWATLYLNFRCVKLSQAWKLPIIVYGHPKFFSTYGKIVFSEKCSFGMVKFNCSISGGPQCQVGDSELDLWGTIIFQGKCEIGTSNKINVGINGILEFGDASKVTVLSNITAYKFVKIGKLTRITHRCQILDTNFHFIADFNKNEVRNWANNIIIGNYCWICNNSTINGGVILPNYTIVASNSLVKNLKSYIPEESLIGGIPAKLLKTGIRRVFNPKFENEIYNFFIDNPNLPKFQLNNKQINHDICDFD